MSQEDIRNPTGYILDLVKIKDAIECESLFELVKRIKGGHLWSFRKCLLMVNG